MAFTLDPSLRLAVEESKALIRPSPDSKVEETLDVEEGYPETVVPENQRESLDIAQHWTLQLLLEFDFFWEQLMPVSFSGGSTTTFEFLKHQLQRDEPNVILSHVGARVKNPKKKNVRFEFASLIKKVDLESAQMLDLFFNLSFDKDLQNWLFLYPVPTSKQFKAIKDMTIGSLVLQSPPIQPKAPKTKRISFEPTPLVVPENYIHQRLIAESFFVPPETKEEEEGLTKRKERFKSRRAPDFYDEELAAIEKRLRETASSEEIEEKVESAWKEMWHTPCTRETLWSMLNEAVTFAPYFSSKDLNLYYTHSEEFQMINKDYTILSSGFAVTENLEKLSVPQQISENKFPCFNKPVIENKFDIVWLLLDLRIQEMYTCSNAFRFLIQMSTDCQAQFLKTKSYTAVPPIAKKKSALKKTTVKSETPLRFKQKWVLTNCEINMKLMKQNQSWYDYTLKPVLLKHLESNENNYLLNTVPTNSLYDRLKTGRTVINPDTNEEEEVVEWIFNPDYLLFAATQFQNFTNSHENSFDAIFIGSYETCSGSDSLLSYFEKEKDATKLSDHFKQYFFMLKTGGIFGLITTKQSLLLRIGENLLTYFNFEIKSKVVLGKDFIFLWSVKTTILGGGETLQWTPEEYFTYMFKLKPYIQDIYAAEKQTTTKMLGLLEQGNVNTSQWGVRLEALFQELLGALTVKQVNEAVTKIRNVEHALVETGKTELEGGHETHQRPLQPEGKPLQPEGERPLYFQPFIAFDTEREMLSLKKRERIETPPELLHYFRQLRGGSTSVSLRVFLEAQKNLRRLQKNQLKLSF